MEITKDNIIQVISALRQCAKEHKNEFTPTCGIIISEICNDVADYLDKIKDCDVVKMPSEEEIKLASNEEINCWCEEGDPHQYVDCDICATPVYRKMFIKGANWLKSKIIK